MANKLYEEKHIQDIANAIRSKTGRTSAMLPNQMATEILSIEKSSKNLSSILFNETNDNGDITALTFNGDNIYAIYLRSPVSKINVEGVKHIHEGQIIPSHYTMTDLTLPSTVEYVDNAFVINENLKTITFRGTPTEINARAFRSTSVTDIYVPWSEGEVANAPWGASNATINYNFSAGGTVPTLTYITATYTGGSVPVGTALTSLTGVTVTAHFSDGSTQNVTNYTLDGTIVAGSNTITVTYNGKTTSFTVTGTSSSTGGKCTVKLTTNGDPDNCYLMINGLQYYHAGTFTFDSGTAIECYATGVYRGTIIVDGSTVSAGKPATYAHTLNGDVEIAFEASSTMFTGITIKTS